MRLKYLLLCLFLLLMAVPALAMPAQETKRVEALLNELAAQPGLVFIRNGQEYELDEALNHLRRKLNYAADQLNSVEEFIDQVASASYMSGRPYQVRLPDGTIVAAGPYLHQLLKNIESQ